MSRLILPADATRFVRLTPTELHALRRQVCRDEVKARTFRFLSRMKGTSFEYEVDRYIDSLLEAKDKERAHAELRKARSRLVARGARAARG